MSGLRIVAKTRRRNFKLYSNYIYQLICNGSLPKERNKSKGQSLFRLKTRNVKEGNYLTLSSGIYIFLITILLILENE